MISILKHQIMIPHTLQQFKEKQLIGKEQNYKRIMNWYNSTILYIENNHKLLYYAWTTHLKNSI